MEAEIDQKMFIEESNQGLLSFEGIEFEKGEPNPQTLAILINYELGDFGIRKRISH